MKNMKPINKIINEEINYLLEREMKNSVPKKKVIDLIQKYNFIGVDADNDYPRITAYYSPEVQAKDLHGIQLNTDFRNVNKLVERCGWTITNYGAHYDGMRNVYERLQKYNSDINIGTFIIFIEPEYSTKMNDYFNDEYFKNEDNKPLYDTFNEKKKKGIFYHITSFKNLKKILKHGLRPKNGGGLTNWRETSERLYLSLLPNFSNVSDVDFNNKEEIDDDDQILLQIDLRPVINSFDFYVDYSYDDAVYTYATIPPQFITVINYHEYENEYLIDSSVKETLISTLDNSYPNRKNEDESYIKDYLNDYFFMVVDILKKNTTNYIKRIYGNRVKYNEDDLIYRIKHELKKYIQS